MLARAFSRSSERPLGVTPEGQPAQAITRATNIPAGGDRTREPPELAAWTTQGCVIPVAVGIMRLLLVRSASAAWRVSTSSGMNPEPFSLQIQGPDRIGNHRSPDALPLPHHHTQERIDR